MAQNDTATVESIPGHEVAVDTNHLGKRRDPHRDDLAPMRYVNLMPAPRGVDVEYGLVLDGEDDGQTIHAAYTNDHRSDWEVRQTGDRVVVEEVRELELADGDEPVPDGQEMRYVQEWVDILVDEFRRDIRLGRSSRMYADEAQMGRETITLTDADGRETTFEYSIETDV